MFQEIPKYHNMLVFSYKILIGLGLGLGIYDYLYLIRKRMFRDAILQMVGDLTSAPETRASITDRWGPIDGPYIECVCMYPSDLTTIIEMDICKFLYPKRLRPFCWTWIRPRVSYCIILLVGSSHASYPT